MSISASRWPSSHEGRKDRNHPIGRSQRGLLLGGVSATAVLFCALAGRAEAAPVPFSPAWYSQRAAGTNTAPGSPPPVVGLTPSQLQQIDTSRQNVARAADALRTIRQVQASAHSAARAATFVRPDGRTVTDGISRNGLWYARGAVTGNDYDVTTAAARAGTAPDGLVWQGAELPTQTSGADIRSAAGGRLTVDANVPGNELVTVKQTASKAIVTWQNFDVGKNTTLYFNQTAADGTPQRSWTVLNRVAAGAPNADGSRFRLDSSQINPTLILGKIKSDGEVFVINQNGIIFGAGSEVNTNTLVASSLDIGLPYQRIAERNTYFLTNNSGRTNFSFQYLLETDAQLIREYGRLKLNLNNPTVSQGFLDNAGRVRVKVNTFAATIAEDVIEGDVVVEPGARLVTGSLDARGNPLGLNADNLNLGRVVLAGPNVRNAGSIRSDDGQVMLLGARNFSLYANDGISGKLADPLVRGALVDIGQQDFQALAPRGVDGARQNSYISAENSLSTIVFGNYSEQREVSDAAQQFEALLSGLAQGGENFVRFDPDFTAFTPFYAKFLLRTETDERGRPRTFVNVRDFANAEGLATAYAGSVVNDGLVDTPRGSVVARANTVVQNAVVTATTSVNQAGLIDLRADNVSAPIATNRENNLLGIVSLAAGSTTSILPDAQVQVDGSLKTIPSDALSLANFRQSVVRIATQNTLLLPEVQDGGLTRQVQTPAIGNYQRQFASTISPQSLSDGSVTLAAGSLVVAPSGSVSIVAGAPVQSLTRDRVLISAPFRPEVFGPVPGGGGNVVLPDSFAAGVTIEGATGTTPGAVVDVAGLSDVVLPMESNVVTVARVGQNELADSPYQRDGFLFRQRNIRVDRRLSGVREDGFAWRGTPLFDASGYIDARQQLVTELMTSGGSIDLTGAVAVGPDALLNIAGGLLTYADGSVDTTLLVTSDGKRTVDIGRANPLDRFSGFAGRVVEDHSRYGITTTFENVGLSTAAGTFEASYYEGGNAGRITFNTSQQGVSTLVRPQSLSVDPLATAASLLAFEGTINAGAVTGQYQRQGSTYFNAANPAPRGGALDLSRVLADTVTITSASNNAAKRAVSPDLFLPESIGAGDLVSENVWRNQYWSTEALSQSGLAELVFGSIGFAARLPDGGLGPRIVGATDRISFGADAGPGGTPFLAAASLQLPHGASLTLNSRTIALDGTLTAHGGNLTLNLIAKQLPGQEYFLRPTGGVNGEPVTALIPRSELIVSGNTILDVSGTFVNDTNASRDGLTGFDFVDGGSIAVTSSAYLNTVTFAPGSRIELSSGGYIRSNGRLGTTGSAGLMRGRGGDLSLELSDTARQAFVALDPATDPALGYTGPLQNVRERIDTSLALDGAINAFGFQGGGTFRLVVPSIAIGEGRDGGTRGDIRLTPAFFTDHGFGSFDLTGVLTAEIEAGVQLALNQQQFIPGEGAAVTGDVASLATIGRWAPGSLQRVATDFRLTGLGLTDLDTRAGLGRDESGSPTVFWLSSSYTADRALVVGSGASILGDPGASIGLAAIGQLTIGNQSEPVPTLILAPGGSIAISQRFGLVTNGDDSGYYGDAPGQNVLNDTPSYHSGLLGAGVTLDAAGVFLRDLSVIDRRAGTLLDGGTVDLSGRDLIVAPGRVQPPSVSRLGLIVAKAGSSIDISGASGTTDQPTGELVRTFTPLELVGNAGTLRLSQAVVAGSIDGRPGGPTALGGTVSIETDNVAQSNGVDVASFAPLGRTMLLTGPSSAAPGGLAVDMLTNTGIDAAVIRAIGGPDSIAFTGSLDLSLDRSLILQAGNLRWSSAGTVAGSVISPATAAVRLAAPYLRLEGLGGEVPNIAAVGGGSDRTRLATLTLAGGTIDISDSHGIGGFATTIFDSAGDIRFIPQDVVRRVANISRSLVSYSKVLSTAGDLVLRAGQVYPATGVDAEARAGFARGLAASGRNSGTITVERNGDTPAAPLSAGGSLTLNAGTIAQNGVLRAPLGEINLGVGAVTRLVTTGAGSLTSVSAEGLQIPYGETVNGLNWFYRNLSGEALQQAPAKAIRVTADRAVLGEGAVIDLSGGGDIYATEFVPGLGGQRNVLTTSLTRDRAAPVYAIVPGVQPAVAPIDPQGYSNLVPDVPGQTLTLLADVPGLAAGTYTLLAGSYATLPGAYRVQLAPGTTDLPATTATPLRDGSVLVAGQLGLSGTDARGATNGYQLFAPDAWRRYSQIEQASGTTFFTNLAAANGIAPAPLPADAGRLSIAVTAATQALGTGAQIRFGLAPGGRGGEVDIAARRIAVVSQSLRDSLAGSLGDYLVLTPADVRAFGSTSLLLGATRTSGVSGDEVIGVATDIRVAPTAADSLFNPELLLVTGPGDLDDLSQDPLGPSLITVEAGSVIEARGATPGASTRTLIFGAETTTNGSTDRNRAGTGALLRVSNAGLAPITRIQTGNPFGTIDIRSTDAAPTRIDGGAALQLDASVATLFDVSASLGGRNIQLVSDAIRFSEDLAPGEATIGTATLRLLANAETLGLRARTAITIDQPLAIAAQAGAARLREFTLDSPLIVANEFAGGALAVDAATVRIINSSAPVGSAAAASGDGRFAITTENLVLSGRDRTTRGFDRFDFAATRSASFGDGAFAGGLTLPGAFTLTTPLVTLAGSSDQAVRVLGDVVLDRGAGQAGPASADAIGGKLAIDADGLVTIGTTLSARAGILDIRARGGDLTVGDGAALLGTGYTQSFGDRDVVAPGSRFTLAADVGDVVVAPTGLIDVSGDPRGNAGSVDIRIGAPASAFSILGDLRGSATSGGQGGLFSLDSLGRVDLDPLAATLAAGGFSGGVHVRSGVGNLVLANNDVIASDVSLTADDRTAGGGFVTVARTIDASGPEGGTIGLFGQQGVTLAATAWLLAIATEPAVEDRGGRGGTVTIGTGVLSPDSVVQSSGGVIDLAAGSQIAVGDGQGYSAGRSSSGATVHVRAPIIAGDVAVTIASTISGARNLVLEGYRRFTTQDGSGFDGIVDPAGWFTRDGGYVQGTWRDTYGGIVEPGEVQTGVAADAGYTEPRNYTEASYFSPTTYDARGRPVDRTNLAHRDFYQDTLVRFAQDAGVDLTPFAGVPGLAFRPGIELVNSDPNRLGGDIRVLSNWNLGAGPSEDQLIYRTAAGEPGVLTLRAAGDIEVSGSISDGFYRRTAYNAFDGFTYAQALEARAVYDPTNTPSQGPLPSFTPVRLGFPYRAPNFAGPLSLEASQYYRYYSYYALRLFPAFANSQVPSGGRPQGTAGALQAGPFISASAATDYLLYSSQYRNYVTQGVDNYNEQETASGRGRYLKPVQPVAPRTDADYGTYAENYFSYLRAIDRFNANLGVAFAFRPDAPRGVFTDSRGILPEIRAFNAPVANDIANNPTAGDPVPVQSSDLRSSGASWSFRFAAGSDTASARADVVRGNVVVPAALGRGDFTLGETYLTAATAFGSNDVIRTGIGEIGIAARGDVRWANGNDTIYTAGIDNGPNAGFVDRAAFEDTASVVFNELVLGKAIVDSVFAKQGGDISIRSGGNISGAADRFGILLSPFRFPIAGGDLGNTLEFGTDFGGLPFFTPTNAPLSRSVSAWLFEQGASGDNPNVDGIFGGSSFAETNAGDLRQIPARQSAQWLNTGRVEGTALALGGGNVRLVSEGAVTDATVAVVSTFQASGGKAVAGAILPVSIDRFGGGNLTIAAGDEIAAASLFVGRGTVEIEAGDGFEERLEPTLVTPSFFNDDGAIVNTTAPLDYQTRTVGINFDTFEDASLLAIENTVVRNSLVLENGVLSLAARNDVELARLANADARNVTLPVSSDSFRRPLPLRPFSQLGELSEARFTSSSGNIRFQGEAINPVVIRALRNPFDLLTLSGQLPPSVAFTALRGNIRITGSVDLAPSPIGNLDILAYGSISYSGLPGTAIRMDDRAQSQTATILAPELGAGTPPRDRFALHAPGLLPLHYDDARTSAIVALTGDLTTGRGLDTKPVIGVPAGDIAQIELAEAATIFAGGDIIDLRFFGQNTRADSVTSITAGRDILFTTIEGRAPDSSVISLPGGSSYSISGPGRLALVAGRNLLVAPVLPERREGFSSSFNGTATGVTEQGILAVGNDLNPYLPRRSAELDILFGVGPTLGRPGNVDLAPFIAAYIDPVGGASRITDYGPSLRAFVNERLTRAEQERVPGSAFVSNLSAADAFAVFRTLDAGAQRALVQQVFFSELRSIADPTDRAQFQNFPRAYTAIDLLFPSTAGYTNNLVDPVTRVRTGNFDMISSLVRTSYGSGINILGPGGDAVIGGLTIDTRPQGIITERDGAINIFLDGNLAVNSSRVFTLQGGDETIFTTNGNIDAGRGRRTAAFLPPLIVTYSPETTASVDFGGLVTGAGIGTLQTIPGGDVADVFLLAPRGDIDAGDAGIRSSRDLFVVANRVLNADNIQVAGNSVGVPQAPTVAGSAIAQAASASQGAQGASTTSPRQTASGESIITVQVTGFATEDDDERRRRRERR